MPDRKNRVEAVTHASTQGDSTFSLRDPACSFRSGLTLTSSRSVSVRVLERLILSIHLLTEILQLLGRTQRNVGFENSTSKGFESPRLHSKKPCFAG